MAMHQWRYYLPPCSISQNADTLVCNVFPLRAVRSSTYSMYCFTEECQRQAGVAGPFPKGHGKISESYLPSVAFHSETIKPAVSV